MSPFRRSRGRFARGIESRLAGNLDALGREGWTVRYLPAKRGHLVAGHGVAFLIKEQGDPPQELDGVRTVCVRWGDFPQEVEEIDGMFHVHGDALLAFLRSQAEPLDDVEISEAD